LGKILAKELEQYYLRRGNRIVFRNGMTLNQLAWDMWEVMNYQAVEPGMLSRVISGKRNFSYQQLETFRGILKLTDNETLRLKEAYKRDLLSRYHIDVEESPIEAIIHQLASDYKKVKLAITRGVPLVAREISEGIFNLSDWLMLQSLTESSRKQVLLIKSKTIILFVDALFGSINEERLYESGIKWIKELRNMSKILKDNTLFRTSYTLQASLTSLSKMHIRTFMATNTGLENGTVNEFQTITALKSAIVSAVNISDYQKIIGYSEAMSQKIDELSPSFKIMAYYSLASGSAKLNNLQTADRFINLGWKQYHQLVKDNGDLITPRRLSLANTEMYIAVNNPGFRDRNYLDQLGKSSIEIAELTGFFRIKEKFEGYLNKLS
jgi:hypothetical protein